MKKLLALMALCVLFTACNSCSHEPESFSYDFDDVIATDYDYIASQFSDFQFRSAEARFDSVLGINSNINYVGTTFQCGEIAYMFFHTTDTAKLNQFVKFAESIGTWKEWHIDTTDADYTLSLQFKDAIIECGEINARNPISFDSCMKIIEPYRDNLHTRALTLRRFIDPRLPENPLYVFGTGILTVDVITGEVGKLTDLPDIEEAE